MPGLLRRRLRQILVDIDTQQDRIYQNGSTHDDFIRRIRRLFAWARIHHVPVISTAIVRRSEGDSALCAGIHGCLEGTPGQEKISYTLLPNHIRFDPENRFDLPRMLLNSYQQVIFEKWAVDPFTLPRADRLLTECKIDQFIVFGTGLENAIKATVLGLLNRRKKVTLLIDAVRSDEERAGSLALRQMEAKGAKLVKTAAFTGSSRLIGPAGPRRIITALGKIG